MKETCTTFSEGLSAYLAEGLPSSSLRHALGCEACFARLKEDAPELQFMLLGEARVKEEVLPSLEFKPSPQRLPLRYFRLAASLVLIGGLAWAGWQIARPDRSIPTVAEGTEPIGAPGVSHAFDSVDFSHDGPLTLGSVAELRERYPLVARVETAGASYYQDTADDGTRMVLFYVPEI